MRRGVKASSSPGWWTVHPFLSLSFTPLVLKKTQGTEKVTAILATSCDRWNYQYADIKMCQCRGYRLDLQKVTLLFTDLQFTVSLPPTVTLAG